MSYGTGFACPPPTPLPAGVCGFGAAQRCLREAPDKLAGYCAARAARAAGGGGSWERQRGWWMGRGMMMTTEVEPSEAPELPLGPPAHAGGRGTRVPPSVSYARVVELAAYAIETLSARAQQPEPQPQHSLRLTVDFPPARSETRAGTLVSRFEHNLSFIDALAERLSRRASDAYVDVDASVDVGGCERLGPAVEIRDNVNPQGGGEYLTDDECLIGVRLTIPLPSSRSSSSSTSTSSIISSPAPPDSKGPSSRCVTILMNAGVDAATLKQVSSYDVDQTGIVVLVNCNLERLSWFAKLGFAKYIESFAPAYYLKAIAPGGWLQKCGDAPWTAYANFAEGPAIIQQYDARPSLVDVQARIRLAISEGSP